MSDAPYRDVRHALLEAFRLESEAICKTSSYLSDLRQSGLRGAAYFQTPWDKFAQASLVLRFTRAHCDNMQIIECKSRIPSNAYQQAAKLAAATKLAEAVDDRHDNFAALCVAEWAGIRISRGWMQHAAKTIGVHISTLFRRKKRIYEALNNLERQILAPLEDKMREAGLIDESP